MQRYLLYKVLSLCILFVMVFTPIFTLNAIADSSFDDGLREGESIATPKWASYRGDCRYADDFLVSIANETKNVARKIRRGTYTTDPNGYGQGFLEGLHKTLKQVSEHCVAECSKVGTASGEFSAEIYCAVSIATKKPAELPRILSTPNIICGEAYTTNCEAVAFSATTANEPACKEYTKRPEFAKYFLAGTDKIGGACIYGIEGDMAALGISSSSSKAGNIEELPNPSASLDDSQVTKTSMESLRLSVSRSIKNDGELENPSINVGDSSEMRNNLAEVGLKQQGVDVVSISGAADKSVKPIKVCCFKTNQASFDVGGGKVLRSSKSEISFSRDNLLNALKENKLSGASDTDIETVVIVGYADHRANDLLNVNLGAARAKSVAAIICKDTDFCSGPNQSNSGQAKTVRPVMISCGRTTATENVTDEERRLQRRVDIYYPGNAMLGDKNLCVRNNQ